MMSSDAEGENGSDEISPWCEDDPSGDLLMLYGEEGRQRLPSNNNMMMMDNDTTDDSLFGPSSLLRGQQPPTQQSSYSVTTTTTTRTKKHDFLSSLSSVVSIGGGGSGGVDTSSTSDSRRNRSIARSFSEEGEFLAKPRVGLFGLYPHHQQGTENHQPPQDNNCNNNNSFRVEELQNTVSSLKERLEESEAKVKMYKELVGGGDLDNDDNEKKNMNILDLEQLLLSDRERKSLRQEVQELQEQLKHCNQELTALRLDSMDDLRRSNSHGTGVVRQVCADEWRQLHTRHDTAMVRAGELAHQLADSKAQVDDLQEQLLQSRTVQEDLNERLLVAERNLKRREMELEQIKTKNNKQQQKAVECENSMNGALRRGFLSGCLTTPRRRTYKKQSSTSSSSDIIGHQLLYGGALPTHAISCSSSDDDDSAYLSSAYDNYCDDNNNSNSLHLQPQNNNVKDTININPAVAATILHLTQKIEQLRDEQKIYEAALEETKSQLLCCEIPSKQQQQEEEEEHQQQHANGTGGISIPSKAAAAAAAAEEEEEQANGGTGRISTAPITTDDTSPVTLATEAKEEVDE